MYNHKWLSRLSFVTILLAFSVIALGAYTRLTDAGLGCPDWPGCYGQMGVPDTVESIAKANAAFPLAPVETQKAQTEMTHRYFAETLGFLIVSFSLFAFWKRKKLALPSFLSPLLIILVLAQGLLGMWTVTLKLHPLIVVSHLLGGFSTLGLLWLCWLFLRNSPPTTFLVSKGLLTLGRLALITVLIQIALGGWTSANYAALICPDFPRCQGQWLPPLNFMSAFNLIGGLGSEAPLSFMDSTARTTIHIMHRLGALLTFLVTLALCICLWRQANKLMYQSARFKLYYFSLAILILLLLQVALGISNVVFFLPLSIAVLHNTVAAILFLTLIALNFMLYQATRNQCVS